MSEDKRLIACNFTETTNIAPKGALAYVQLSNPGGGHDRIWILVRSHGGRWVSKWEAMKRLGNFRFKTIPLEHPIYDRWPWNIEPVIYPERLLMELREASKYEHSRSSSL